MYAPACVLNSDKIDDEEMADNTMLEGARRGARIAIYRLSYIWRVIMYIVHVPFMICLILFLNLTICLFNI